MKPKYTEQDYFALSESDMEELEEVCEMMNSLSLELSFGKANADIDKHRARYILESFNKRLYDVIDNAGEKIFRRREFVVVEKGRRMDRWTKILHEEEEDYLASIMGDDYKNF
jgi:hypothetical protein